jgi:hypothetical protein
MIPDYQHVKTIIWEALPDQLALRLQYHSAHGRFPNLTNPKALSEKIQYRKLYDRDPRLPIWADKIKVKPIVADIIGEEYVIPTLWEGRELDTFAVRELPRPFIIKPSHSSGAVVIIREGDDYNWAEIKMITNGWVSDHFGTRCREWLYSEIEPGIIVEPLIGDGESVPVDFKFFVFHGRVECVHVDFGRYGVAGRTQAILDRDWKRLPVLSLHPGHWGDVSKPEGFENMLSIAETIGAHFEFVRVDLYNIDGHPWFGEATFYPASGFAPYHPRSFDEHLGSLWHIGDDR